MARTRTLLLATCAATLVLIDLSHAQSLTELRGEITEAEAAELLYEGGLPRRRRTEDDVARPLNRTGQTDQARPAAETTTPAYDPASLGGLTEAEEQNLKEATGVQSIFEDSGAEEEPDDPFAESAPIPTPRARRQTAEDRAQQANERATASGRSTAQDRQTAEESNRAPGSEEDADENPTTGTLRAESVDAENRTDLILDPGAERETAIESLDIDEEDNPYEAVGLRVGSFILRPSVEQGLTATTNASSSAGGSDAILSETTLRLNGVSDWSQHNATLDAYGIFRRSISGEELDETEGGVDATLDYELSHEFQLKTALGYSFEPESASSPDAISNVVTQPTQHNLDGSIGLSKDVGKLRLGVTGKVDREWYDDAELETGEVLPQDDRNSTLASVALRTGYEISPSIRPFVEVEAGHRFHDEEIDANGFARSSDIISSRVGVEIDRDEKLTGEISAGVLRETFDDDRLEPVTGPSIAANLRWSPERDTTIGLLATTSVDSTTIVGNSGSLLYVGRLTLERQVRANLTANGMLGIDLRDYSESSDRDITYYAELGATWWLNRYAGLTGRAKYETLRSDQSERDYDETSVFLGLRLQR